VEHLPEAPSKAHPVRAQNRPDHPVGAASDRASPEASANPVVSSGGLPELASTPGHTVPPHRFVNVNVTPPATDPACTRYPSVKPFKRKGTHIHKKKPRFAIADHTIPRKKDTMTNKIHPIEEDKAIREAIACTSV
jgi:hypothetical protein